VIFMHHQSQLGCHVQVLKPGRSLPSFHWKLKALAQHQQPWSSSSWAAHLSRPLISSSNLSWEQAVEFLQHQDHDLQAGQRSFEAQPELDPS